MDMFEVQRDSEWKMAGWHIGTMGGMVIYHPRGCTTCGTYAAHLMAVYEEGAIRLSNRIVGQAIKTAWLRFLCSINNGAEDQWQDTINLSKEILKT